MFQMAEVRSFQLKIEGQRKLTMVDLGGTTVEGLKA